MTKNKRSIFSLLTSFIKAKYLKAIDESLFFFFLRNKHTHTRGGKEFLTQRHTTTPLKSHGNF